MASEAVAQNIRRSRIGRGAHQQKQDIAALGTLFLSVHDLGSEALGKQRAIALKQTAIGKR
jgi:hypothetical protein